MSRRFGKTVSGRGVPACARRDLDELGRFAMFAQLSPSDLEAVAGISRALPFDTGQQIITEGAEADTLYLFVKGNAAVKVSSAEGQQVLIDQVGPGELVGWSAVIEPHVYVASAWTTEPSEVIGIPGDELRALAKANSRIGYQVVKGIGEVMSKRFEKAIGRYDVDELRRFKMFADIDRADLDSIAKITSIEHYETGRELTAEGAPAERMYLFVKGRAAVKVRSPEDSQVLIDEIRPGDLLGWSAAMDPYVYTASSWTTEPSEVIVVPGEDLRRLCESNKRIGYDVGKGIGEVISRRFGQAIGRHGDLLEKDLRAFQGEELVVWDNGELQLTTEAVLIGMGSEDPEVIPLEAVLDVEVQDGCVIFHAHGGDARSPRLDAPERFAALVRDEMLRTRHAHRRRS